MPSANSQELPSHAAHDLPRPFRWRDQWFALIVCVIALAAIPFNAKTGYLFYHVLKVLPITHFLMVAVESVTWWAISLLILAIALLDKPRRKTLVYLLVALVVTGGTNRVVKEVTGRARPYMTLGMTPVQHSEIENYINRHPDTPIRFSDTDEWILLSRGRPWYFMDSFVSFPSGHSAMAFTIAAFLVILYPRWRVVWFLFAIGCAAARVRFLFHFVEDVMFGGAMAWILASWVYSWQWPARAGESLRRRISARIHRR